MEFSVQGLHKRFGDNHVLSGIDFSSTSGKALGLLGRNGAGKTTTIRIVMGVFPADEGGVLVDGAPIDRKKIGLGYLPEEHGLYPKQKIDAQLLYLAELRGMHPRQAKLSIMKWLDRLDMTGYAGKRLDTLSKGNQQKIQLAAALITEPDIVILDEPFSGLDPVNAALLKDVVRELIQAGRIVLFSSHQMNYVEEFCDAIAILHGGHIVLSGAIEDIKRSYDRSVIHVRSRQAAAVAEYSAGLTQFVSASRVQKSSPTTASVTLSNPAAKNRLMEALAEKDLDIDSIAVYEPSLSDIFVEFTGSEAEKEALR